MVDVPELFLPSRRSVLALAAGAGLSAWRGAWAASVDFWNHKPPEEWSAEEIEKLTTNSPWARPVNAEASGNWRGNQRGGSSGPDSDPTGSTDPRVGRQGGPTLGIPGLGLPRIGVGGRGGPRMGGPGMGGGGGRGGGRQSREQFKGTVRWESAEPVLAALKTTLPEAFAGHYVISVSGFPYPAGRRNDSTSDGEAAQADREALDRLKSFTSLDPKGRSGAQPGVVERQFTTGSGSILFGFSKELLDLSADDSEVSFATTIGRAVVKTKFDFKAMRYHGKLAV